MDDADRADKGIEKMIEEGMARARKHIERSMPVTGRCHWCSDESPGRVFCSKECSIDFDREREARLRNGVK